MTGLYNSNLEGKNRGKRKLSEKQDDMRTRGGHSEEEDMTDAPETSERKSVNVSSHTSH